MCERRSRAATSRWLGAESTQGTSRMLLMCLEGSSHGKRGCPRSDTRPPAHHGEHPLEEVAAMGLGHLS